MKKKLERGEDNVDIWDIDWQAECQKGNYIVGNDAEGYRISVHNIVDEGDRLYQTEGEAWEGLYDHLIAIGETVDILPSYEELRGK